MMEFISKLLINEQKKTYKKDGHDTGGKEQEYTRIRYINKEKQKHASEDLSAAQKR